MYWRKMGTPLQQMLRSLCFNTHWKYGVFWKLKHGPRIVLTWEDVWINEATESSITREFNSHVSISSAVSKMSYQVYSLGEGIVGQVAISGQHAWTFSHHHAAEDQYFGEWEAQFSAGIKTIAVVAVVPHGVVQLGSEYEIVEDLDFIDHIRSTFYELLHNSISAKSDKENWYLSDTCTTTSDSAMEDCIEIFTRFLHEDDTNFWTWLFAPQEESANSCHVFPTVQGSSGNTTQCHRETNFRRLETKPELPSAFQENEHAEMKISPFSFSSGSELHEALGPSFLTQNNSNNLKPEETSSYFATEVSNGISSCSVITESPDMQLLDAVVAKISRKYDETKICDDEKKIDKSHHETEGSLLTAERTPCTSSSLNSLASVVEALKGLSPASSSRGSDYSENQAQGHVRVNKKRARPGESSRPRPRDRQLIQDRIKELRELVPNGSKCSIDSLLERTIKHMLYMQSITKHAEKLTKCSTSKETCIRSFPCGDEQGSTWAMEVGNQNVSPIMVENVNMDGNMLVEMLCEECSHFLVIADTIRSLGLTILKGISAACGNKTRFSFVVEPQNNSSIHRMDVLWSLMQLLQTRTPAEC